MMKLAKPCQEHSFSPIVIHGAFKDDLESELILLTFMLGIKEERSGGMINWALRDFNFIN